MSDTKMRHEFESAMADVLREDQGEFAMSRAHDDKKSYTFLATKWAWKAWQAAQLSAPASNDKDKRIAELETALREIAASEWYGADHVDEVARDMQRIALQAFVVAPPQGERK